jgi:hypothetical protein
VADGLDCINDLLDRNAAVYRLARTTGWHAESVLRCHPGPF